MWLNQTLSMITYADPRSLQPASCIQLNLGIGMMRPDWMMAPPENCLGDIWITAKSAGFDEDYHRSVHTRISALDQDDGNFGEYRRRRQPGTPGRRRDIYCAWRGAPSVF